jgi:hypothetical protein
MVDTPARGAGALEQGMEVQVLSRALPLPLSSAPQNWTINHPDRSVPRRIEAAGPVIVFSHELPRLIAASKDYTGQQSSPSQNWEKDFQVRGVPENLPSTVVVSVREWPHEEGKQHHDCCRSPEDNAQQKSHTPYYQF